MTKRIIEKNCKIKDNLKKIEKNLLNKAIYFLFPLFSLKSVQILENNATKHFVEISAEKNRKILVKTK